MKGLIIDNFGPISHVDMDLKRINILMGPQSAGKSCILKIACFCACTEKCIELEQDKNGFADFSYVEQNLIQFHKLNGFLRAGSKFSYQTEHMSFVCDFDKQSFDLSWNEDGRWSYKRPRVSYIPAERNLIAVVPNWLDVRISNSNILNFISDWNLTRQFYKKNESLPLLDLDASYYYDRDAKSDNILLHNGKSIDFTNASSGLQSVVPMWGYLNYLFNLQYKSTDFTSVSKDAENEDIFASEQEYEECKKLVESYTKNVYSEIFLEEPELNLFPQTQLELIYKLLEKSAVHHDGIIMSSHSPYILYALNNSMLGYLVKDKLPADDSELMAHKRSWINPQEVGLWELYLSESGTTARVLQDEEGLISYNYFDSVMQSVMNDFTNYSVYYD